MKFLYLNLPLKMGLSQKMWLISAIKILKIGRFTFIVDAYDITFN